MFRDVLIPINLSTKEQQVVETATGLVECETGSATLLHVIEEIEGLAGQEGDRFYEGLRERAAKILEERAQVLVEAGLDVRRVVEVGKRAHTIVSFARDHGCDLIVMGSHSIDPDNPAKGLWTTSQKVAVLCDCPILLVR